LLIRLSFITLNIKESSSPSPKRSSVSLYNEDTTYYSGQEYREGSNNGNERYIDSDDGNIKDYKEEVEDVVNTNTSNVDLFV